MSDDHTPKDELFRELEQARAELADLRARLGEQPGDTALADSEALRTSQAELKQLNEELEARVAERTRELAEQAEELRNTRRATKLVLSSMPDLLFVVDATDRIVDCYAKPDHPDLAASPDEFLNQPFDRVLPSDVSVKIKAALDMARTIRGPTQVDYTLKLPQGTQHFDATFSPIEGTNNLLVVISNVTERKRAEVQLIRYEKMAALGQLLAGVAHEINNPVNFIYGNMGLMSDSCGNMQQLLTQLLGASPTPAHSALLESTLGTAELDEFFGDMKTVVRDCTEGARRVRDIVRSLRSFAHPDRGRWAPMDLLQGLEDSLVLLSHEFGDRIEIRRDYEKIPAVVGDATQLNQVFLNLLLNATQSIEGRGSVSLRTALEGGEAVIAIGDTGHGISEAHIEQIFDPFFTTKELGRGTGLGLAICYGIVRSHAGSLTVESQPGRGSTFTVRLPVGD
ncbi:MAG: ATP-binding protein [bacterium]